MFCMIWHTRTPCDISAILNELVHMPAIISACRPHFPPLLHLWHRGSIRRPARAAAARLTWCQAAPGWHGRPSMPRWQKRPRRRRVPAAHERRRGTLPSSERVLGAAHVLLQTGAICDHGPMPHVLQNDPALLLQSTRDLGERHIRVGILPEAVSRAHEVTHHAHIEGQRPLGDGQSESINEELACASVYSRQAPSMGSRWWLSIPTVAPTARPVR